MFWVGQRLADQGEGILSSLVHCSCLAPSEPQRLEGFQQQAWRVALSADGRFAAAADGQFNADDGVIRVWDLETGDVRILDRGEGDRGHAGYLEFTPENRLVSGGYGDVRRWDIDDGTFEILRDGEGENPHIASGLSPDGRFLASFARGDEHPFVHDLESGNSWEVSSHGEVRRFALDTAGKMLLTTGPTIASNAAIQEARDDGCLLLSVAAISSRSTVRLGFGQALSRPTQTASRERR